MEEALVVNFFAGPGARKSTLAAHVFAELKWNNINAELVTEYAKDKTWEESYNVLDDQLYVLGKQFHRLFRLKDKVSVIVTDSPLLLSINYNKLFDKDVFNPFVFEAFNKFNNLNYFVVRQNKYNSAGRSQTLEQSKEIDSSVKNILEMNKTPFSLITGTEENVALIVQDILKRIG
jgi:hypothetical protein